MTKNIKKLTERDVEKYVAKDGSECPFCHSENISGDIYDYETMTQPVECLDCGKKWKDILGIVGIFYNGKEFMQKGDE